MAQIQSITDRAIVSVDDDETILDALLNADIPHSAVCGGQARCSTCRVIVVRGIQNCSQPTKVERNLAERLHFPVHVRLACQTRVVGDVDVRRLVIDSEDLDLVDSQFESDGVGAEQPVAIVVIAVRGATNFDEVNFPYDILYIMGRYFRAAHRIITSNGGSVDSVMGGRMVVTFRSGTPQESVERAVWTGLEMLEAVRDLNESLEKLAYQPLEIGMGIHYGSAIMVPVTSDDSPKVVPLGGVLSVASRVQDASKRLETQLLLSEPAYRAVEAKAQTGCTTTVDRPDKQDVMMVYEVTGMAGEAPEKVAPVAAKPTAVSLSERLQSFMQRLGLGG